MNQIQDTVKERNHYENLYQRDGDHHFIGSGYEKLHSFTVEKLPENSSILDIGCGSGQHSRRFASQGFRVAGVELALTALKIGRKIFDEKEIAGSLICGNVKRLPFADKSFDACFMSLILHHFLKFDDVLKEAARVSKRYLFVFEPNSRNPQTHLLLNIINPIFRPKFLTANQRAVSSHYVEQLLDSEGYQLKDTLYATVGSTPTEGLSVKNIVYGIQSCFPESIRHNKFIQVYERKN